MRLLVCGDRNWSNRQFLYDTLDDLLEESETPIVVIHGAARGADTMAGEWGMSHKLLVLEYPAQWHVYGKSAGPIRNRQMLEEGKPELVYAFHQNIAISKGTKDMVAQAQKAGIRTKVVP